MTPQELSKRIASAYSEIRLTETADGYRVNLNQEANVFVRRDEDGSYRVEPPHGHAHRPTLEAALDLVWELLRGQARSVEEYCDGQLAATWIERADGDNQFVLGDVACYLSPFDAVEWEPNGLVWRTIRYTCRPADGDVREERMDLESSQSQLLPIDSLEWIPNALGRAPEGFTWTVGPGSMRCVLPVPSGWTRRKPGEPGFDDFVPPTGHHLLRVTTYFREPSAPQNPFRETTIRASSREVETLIEGEWSCDKISLTFHGDDQDMLVVLWVYWPTNTDEPPGFRDSIARASTEVRMTPEVWHMEPEF